MKVVLFCGGQGIRMREAAEAIPKPMVRIGYRPILWHVMRYYAHFGHTEFILCLGYRGDAIKEYFLHYQEELSNDFVLSDGGRRIDLLGSDIQGWRITFADTGLHSTTGDRLRAVRRHLEGEELFLANYGDTITDTPMNDLVNQFVTTDATASFLSVRPAMYPFRLLETNENGAVRGLRRPADADLWINGGYFILRPAVFDVIHPGEELVEAPFQRLIEQNSLRATRYEGFWAPMDTLRDVERLEALARSGRPPWAVWAAGAEVPS